MLAKESNVCGLLSLNQASLGENIASSEPQPRLFLTLRIHCETLIHCTTQIYQRLTGPGNTISNYKGDVECGCSVEMRQINPTWRKWYCQPLEHYISI